MSNLGLNTGLIQGPNHDHPLDLEQLRRGMATLLPGFTEDIRSGLLVPAPGNPTRIDPDDPAVVGVGPAWAFEDHAHPISTGAPSALLLVSANAEGSSVIFVRADHQHSTAALPWGEVGRQVLTSSNGPHAASAITDHNLTITTDVTRLYKVFLSVQTSLSAGGNWTLNLHDFGAGGTLIKQLGRVDCPSGATQTVHMLYSCLWEPASGSQQIDVRALENAGAASLTLNGSATVRREFWVEDIGPR